jgi:hypothetical protein
MYGGFATIALGDSPCAEKTTCVKPKCGFCSWLSGKCEKSTCPKETKCVKASKCGLCDKLAGKCPPKCPSKCATNGSSSDIYGYQSPSPNANADLPPKANPGDCFAKAVIPAEFTTVSERHMTQEASERLEIIPAEYKWVEERILVKECSTQLEAVPAEYKWTEKTIEVKPAHTGWVLQKAADCEDPEKALRGDVFCLRTTPAEFKTVRTQCLVKPACTREITIPAEYQTIRRQVVACPARTKKVCIPAAYEDIQRTVMVCPERVKWERVVCEDKMTAETLNKVKTALLASGYKPGPLNGQLAQEDWTAIKAFQAKSRLGVGILSYDTLKLLGVSVQ